MSDGWNPYREFNNDKWHVKQCPVCKADFRLNRFFAFGTTEERANAFLRRHLEEEHPARGFKYLADLG